MSACLLDAGTAQENAIKYLEGVTDQWVERVTIGLYNGSIQDYGTRDDKTPNVGPVYFSQEEILVKVEQHIRWDPSKRGVGDYLRFSTMCIKKPRQVVVISGNQEGWVQKRIIFDAPAGKQIVGLQFDKGLLVGVDLENYTAGCVPNFWNSTMYNYSQCPSRLEFGEICQVSCATGFNGHAGEFSCPNVSSQCPPIAIGEFPICHQVETLGNGAVLVVVAALTAATAGAYGVNRSSRTIVDGNNGAAPNSKDSVKLSMSGVWRDVSDGSVFMVEPTDLLGAPTIDIRMLSRKCLRLLFDIPLSKEEAYLSMSEVRPGPCCMWQFNEGNSPMMLSSVGLAESAGEEWWKGNMLWTAGEGATLERVSQHRLVLQLPPARRARPRVLVRRKVSLTRLWNYLFPAVVGILVLCSLIVPGSLLSTITYGMSLIIHLRSCKMGRHECIVPASIPRLGSVGLLLAIIAFDVWHGSKLSTQLDMLCAAIDLACLFFLSNLGYRCLVDGISVFVLAICAMILVLILVALELHFLMRLLKDRGITDLAALCCIASGVLQLAAAKIWSNRSDVPFGGNPPATSNTEAIEMCGSNQAGQTGQRASAITFSMDQDEPCVEDANSVEHHRY